MALKVFKPITAGTRGRVDLRRDELTTNRPEKTLVSGRKSCAGRGAGGRISVRHQGGGHKRRYRDIDFKRNKHGIPGTVKSIEYDPFRSANIALIYYADGDKRYIIAPKGLQVGQKIMSGENATPTVGNALPLNAIPVGFTIHNIELTLGSGGQLVRSAGASAMIAGREGDYVIVRLPSSIFSKRVRRRREGRFWQRFCKRNMKTSPTFSASKNKRERRLIRDVFFCIFLRNLHTIKERKEKM